MELGEGLTYFEDHSGKLEDAISNALHALCDEHPADPIRGLGACILQDKIPEQGRVKLEELLDPDRPARST